MGFDFKVVGGGVTAPQGFQAAGVEANIKYNRRDLAVIYSEQEAAAAGVFTTNKVKAAPLLLTMKNLENGVARAIVVNSGNANACTGEQGMHNARMMAEKTAKVLDIKEEDVIVSSTGVIGVQLPIEKALEGIDEAAVHLSPKGGEHAALAIMTTDTFPKEIAVEFIIDGRTATIGAMAKGSGMIHPNMATMLGFITTDANVSHEALDKALKSAVNKSFNLVNVDGDTSTNDMAVVMANGMVGNKKIYFGDENWLIFQAAMEHVCVALAKMMAKDGEGATKLVEIIVKGAKTEEDGRKAAMSINKSSLVKTAIFGEDANWGRILAAVGYSGADFDPNLVDVYLGDEKMAEDGMGLEFSEERAKEILSKDHVIITVDMKLGEHEVTAWGCDLSYKYVEINADYRT